MIFKISPISLAVFFSFSTQAGMMRSDVPVLEYQDFALNKGIYAVGATGVKIYDKQNNAVGNLGLPSIPDLSMIADPHTQSQSPPLIYPQYFSTASHVADNELDLIFNGGAVSPDSHTSIYIKANTNALDSVHMLNSTASKDLSVPRLNKLVTEVVPLPIVDSAGLRTDLSLPITQRRYTHYVRAGAGQQWTRDVKTSAGLPVSDVFNYITAGTLPTDNISVPSGGGIDIPGSDLIFGNIVPEFNTQPMVLTAQSGDSGSGLFVWDNVLHQWEFAGNVTNSTLLEDNSQLIPVPNGKAVMDAWFRLTDQNYLNQIIDGVTDPNINDIAGDGNITWHITDQNTGIASLDQGKQVWISHGADTSQDGSQISLTSGRVKLDTRDGAGKNLTFSGDGNNIILMDSIDQGAGVLTFEHDYIVKPALDQTWKGGGIIVENGASVDWLVNGVDGDSLHKLGTGTLNILGTGENKGDLSVGDGIIVLSQHPDSNGHIQAFNHLDIVSGRPKVVLSNAQQINPDNIYFGFRGGVLDIHGNNLSFKHIHDVDSGAKIVNYDLLHPATVSITGYTTKQDISVHQWNGLASGWGLNSAKDFVWINRDGIAGEFYTYPGYGVYQLLHSGHYGMIGNHEWKLIYDLLSYSNNQVYLGSLGDTSGNSGILNLSYSPTPGDTLLNLAGGANLNGGVLSVNKGTVLLSAGQSLHSDGTLYEWMHKDYTLSNILLSDSAILKVGENATLNGNITAGKKSLITVGYVTTPQNSYESLQECIVYASVECTNATDGISSAIMNGDIQANDDSKVIIGHAELNGGLNTSITSSVDMQKNSIWNINKDSTIGNLNINSGAVNFFPVGAARNYHTLNVKGSFNGGGGVLTMNTDTSTGDSDKIIIDGASSGNYQIDVKDQRSKILSIGNNIQLIHYSNANNLHNAVFSLSRGHVDIGALRYILQLQQNDYILFNALNTALPPTQPGTLPATQPGTPRGLKGQLNQLQWENVIQNEWVSNSANTVISNYTSQYNLADALNNATYRQVLSAKNLGDGVWLKSNMNRLNYHSDDYRSYKQNMSVISLGYDSSFSTSSGNIITGIGMNIPKSSGNYDDRSTGSTYALGGMLFAKWILPGNYWASSDLTYTNMKDNISNSSDSEKYNSETISSTFSGGHRVEIISGVHAGVDVRISNFWLSNNHYIFDGMDVKNSTLNLMQYGTGLSVDKSFYFSHSNGDFFVRADYRQLLSDNKKIKIDGMNFNAPLSKNEKSLQVGGSVNISGGWTLGINATYSKGKNISSQIEGGGGIEYHW